MDLIALRLSIALDIYKTFDVTESKKQILYALKKISWKKVLKGLKD